MRLKFGRHRDALVLRLDTFTVSSFNLTNSPVFAKWDAELTLGNRDGDLNIVFEPFTGSVYYREDPLSCASIAEAIHLAPKRQKTLHVRFDRTGCEGEQPFIEDRILKQITEDRANGTLHCSLRIQMKATYGVLIWSYDLIINSSCPDMKVEFVPATGDQGKMIGSQRNCSAPLLEF